MEELNQIERSSDKEVIQTPEIFVHEEEGAQLLSFILKAKVSGWGDDDSAFSKDTDEYFQKNPLAPEISGFLDKIHALEDGGVDEEALYILALTYGHPERTEWALDTIAKNKSYIKEPLEVQQDLFRALDMFKQSFSSSSLSERLVDLINEDKHEREQTMKETTERIEKIIAFFRPDPDTTTVRKISLMPTDPLYKEDSGSGFAFGQELVLKSNIKNPDNTDHEFSHSIINPIVDRLSYTLTEEQKEKAVQLSSNKLKEDYGNGYYSLLCEELIRTYNDIFKKGEKSQTVEGFKQRALSLDEDGFQNIMSENHSFKMKCKELGIDNVQDFKDRSQEYFDRFEKNPLRDLIFKIYQEYSDRPDKSSENFEQFIIDKLPNSL